MLGRTTVFAIAALVLAGTVPAAHADSITVNGRAYDEVLIYKSSSIYYVKIPHEGRVISVPVDRVDSSTVSINEDPYYRDKLKERYDEAKADIEAGRPVAGAPTDPAFDVPDASGSEFDSSALYGAGAGKPLNLTQEVVQGTLTNQGFEFTGTTGKTSDGLLTVQLEGPPENLTGVVVTATGQQAQLMAAMPKIFGVVAQKAPWATGWVQQNMQSLMQGQAIQNVQNGVYLSITPQQAGTNLSISVAMRGA